MKRYYKILAFLIPLYFCQLSYAQREASNWYFGSFAGLDFNSGSPLPLLDGVLDTTEGCESISDPEGNLLFYTDGKTIWNKNHEIMDNGESLLGSFSSTQSALIVPNVDNPNIYYLFTADVVQAYQDDGIGNGFNYSIVDMSLDGGLGGVTQKNINLLSNSSEKITAVSAFDNSGYWVITHKRKRFYAYKVSASGVNTVPVSSNIGPDIENFNNIRGSIKASPNGDKIAIAHAIFEPQFNGSVYLYDFDIETGVVSNETFLGDNSIYYGIEFSSNSKFLYTSSKTINNGSSDKIQIHQFDLTNSNIIASEYLVHEYGITYLSDLAGALQIGIDKKIYHSIASDKLSVIRTPNLLGIDSDFREFQVDIGDRATRFGLPPFIQSFFESIITMENFCFNDETQFSLETDEVVESISWNFGDLGSGANNVSSLLEPSHTFSTTGVFTVTIDVDFESRPSQTYVEFVEINAIPQALPSVVLTQCDVDGVDDGLSKFNLNEAISLFNQGNTNLTANYFLTLEDAQNNDNALIELGYENTVNNQIIYARVFENAECFAITQIELNVEPMSNLYDYKVLDICLEEFTLVAIFDLDIVIDKLLEDFPNTDITLYDSELEALLETDPILDEVSIGITMPPKKYFRIENSNACAFIGKVSFNFLLAPQGENKVIEFCYDDDLLLDAGDGFLTYLWSTGEVTQVIEPPSEGVYTVEVTNANCSAIFEFEVVIIDTIDITTVEVNDFRALNSIIIKVNLESGFIDYSIDGGYTFQENYTFSNLAPGIYEVIARNNNCSIDTKTVIVGGYPNFFTPNGDGYHDTWQISMPELYQKAKIKIFDRYGKVLKELKSVNEVWDGRYNGEILRPSDYWFELTLDRRVVYGHFTLKL